MAYSPRINREWLNKTANKTVRPVGSKYVGIVYHETASPNPTNSPATLNFNLAAKVESSYHYLIGRDGTIYHYLDEDKYTAWHAGVSTGLGYSNFQLSVHTIGIEIDGKCDGTPATEAQIDALVWLVRELCTEHKIPVDRKNHVEHSEIALPKGRRSDPRAYEIPDILRRVKESTASVPSVPTTPIPADIQVLGVPQVISVERAIEAFRKRQARLTDVEVSRIYSMCQWLELDIRFLIAVAEHEAGLPLGNSPLQKLSNCPINMRAASGEWRPKVKHPTRGDWWLSFESYQLGCFASIVHLKNVYGPQGLLTVRQIINVLAPASDGNAPDSYANKAIRNMNSM